MLILLQKPNFCQEINLNQKQLVFLKDVKSYEIIDINNELVLWDNLFYQVSTQNNFYLKETLMQILVFNNLLKEISKIKFLKDKIEVYETLASARVVLPSDIFDANNDIEIKPSSKISNVAVVQEDIQEINRNNANATIKSLEKAITEVSKLGQNFLRNRQIAYSSAFESYNLKNEPLNNQYSKDLTLQKKRLYDLTKMPDFDPNDPSNEKELNRPEFPKFVFDYPLTIDDKSLKKDLSSASYEAIKKINAINDNNNYQDLVSKIEEALQNEHKTIVDNTQFSNKVLVIGGFEVGVNQSKPNEAHQTNNAMVQAFVPEKFGVRNIGIADYKKVVSHVCHYSAGEVSHIENIMAKELRSKTTTRERIEELTQTDQTEQEKEKLTDSSTTERFEMQTEVSKLIAEDRQIGAYAKYSNNSFGSFEVGANYATNNSKEESNRQAVTQAKDITNRAMERIVTKVRKETIRKTTEKFKEENVHAFDNRNGENHVSGVYRFINAIYENQVQNYGKRMMYEFMIPQPSKLHVLGLTNEGNVTNPVTLIKPIDPRTIDYENFTKINESNYLTLTNNYQAELILAPTVIYKNFKKLDYGQSIDGDPKSRNFRFDIGVPVNYKTNFLSFYASIDRFDAGGAARGYLQVPNNYTQFIGNASSCNYDFTFGNNEIINNIDIQVVQCWDINSFNFDINCTFVPTTEFFNSWQKQVFDAIIAGYEKQLAAYNKQLGDVVVTEEKKLESNPGFYRQIEQTSLRKNCISYLMDETKMGQDFYNGDDLKSFQIDQSKEMDNYANFCKFMEQSFDWDNMSYNFYPFYWGKREDWKQLYQYECNDPLFRSYMQAGMARVIVTVKPGFENAIMHYMTTNQIWNGGEVPVIGNPLYLSIVDELKQQEYQLEETWQTVVPTSLIGLQSSGVSVEGKGLPHDPDCVDQLTSSLVDNNEKLIAVKPV